jgi:hypothetical protein
MPLDIIGDYAASGSSGASARNAARVSNTSFDPATPDVAGVAVRDEKPAREEVAVSAPTANVAVYVSPFIRLDITSRLAIVEIRNSETGEVQQQYPSPRAVREYQQNLPEDSDLRARGTNDGTQSAQSESRSSTPGDSSTQTVPPGLESTPAPLPNAPAPSANPQAGAAAAAFSSFQSVPTGGKQVAIA